MKMIQKFLAFILLSSIGFAVQAQNTRLIIDDQLGLINDDVREKIKTRLAQNGITVEENVEYAKRCEYWYAVFVNTGSRDRIQLKNCKERIVQAKDIDALVNTLGPIEKSIILSSNLYDLISRANDKTKGSEPIAVVEPELEAEVPEYFDRQINEHNTRYFFSPSGYNLRKAEIYYNTVDFIAHDVQLGLTDNLSIGMGTTLAFTPLYITPKVSFELNEINRVSVGDLFMAGTYNNDFIANLAYFNYTYGTPNNNATISTGLVSYDGNNDYLIHGAAMTQISRHLYFVTEHYYIPMDKTKSLYKPYNPTNPDNTTLEVTVPNMYFMGHLGVRYVSKTVDTKSWHFGVAYFANLEEAIDKQKYIAQGYETLSLEKDDLFFIIPSIAFTYKIGKKM